MQSVNTDWPLCDVVPESLVTLWREQKGWRGDSLSEDQWLILFPPTLGQALHDIIAAGNDARAAASKLVRERLESLPGAQYLTVVSGSFRGRGVEIAAAAAGIDFMWFDCGGHREYRDFLTEYWPLLDGNAGTLLMHYTLTNLTIGSVIKDLKIKQATTGFSEFELLSFREPHKMMQNSVSIVRKTSELREPIYYEVRDISLEAD